MRSKLYLVILFVFWELFKDRWANWANNKIDQNAGAAVKGTVCILEWAAGQPLIWTVIVVIIVFSIIFMLVFLHSYFTNTTGQSKITNNELSDNLNEISGGVLGFLSER